MDGVTQDIRYAVRQLARSPGFAVIAVLTLAIGIGANTAVFSIVNALLLRPPAHVAEPEQLVALYTSDFSGPLYGASSHPDFEVFREQRDVFAGVTVFSPQIVSLGEGDALERIGVETVSGEYFAVLGTPMHLGRGFIEEEGLPGTPPVAVISHGLWQRRFAGDPSLVGRTIRLNGVAATVVGVAPEGFRGRLPAFEVELWMPLTAAPAVGLSDASRYESRGNRGFLSMARLAPGVTLAQARARMDLVAEELHAAYPQQWTDVNDAGRRITLLPEREARVPMQVRGPVLGFMALLAGVVGIVLLICCANLAGLLLARATGRAREMAIRVSLGAQRGRIIRQLLTESLLLAGAGAGVAILLTLWITDAFSGAALPLPAPVALDLAPDGRVFAFTAAVTLLAGVAFGVAPALRASRPDPATALQSSPGGGPAGGARGFSLRSALVVGQVALSLLLVVGATLFLRSLQEAGRLELGFEAEGVLLAELLPPPGSRVGPEDAPLLESIRERLAAAPGVVSVTWADNVPFGPSQARWGTSVEGHDPAPGDDMEFHTSVVGPDYFETMAIPLLAGRGLTAADREGAPGAIVVNEAFARRFWPEGDALGRRVDVAGPREVVGVVRTGTYLSPAEAPRPFMYLPALQVPRPATLHLRAAADAPALAGVVRRDVAELAPRWSVGSVRTMEDQIGLALLPQRVAGGVLGVFGMLALGLAALGLYGVIAYAVASRTREIGIRVALGADRGAILRLVLRQGLGLVAGGALLGLGAAFALTRLLESFLLGSSPLDPLTFASSVILLGAVGLAATWIPARRAARVDPIIALRSE